MENNYYPATIEECYHGMDYEICEWFYKGVNGEDILTGKNNTEKEVYCKWSPFKLNLADNTTFINHRTSFNHFCFHVGNGTARIKTTKYIMTPQEELEILDELYVAKQPEETHRKLANRIGELLNLVNLLPKTFETEIPGLFYEYD